jgi:hypothetical protein
MDTAKKHTPETWTDLRQRLEDGLATIQREESNVIKLAARAIQLSSSMLQNLQETLAGYGFRDGEEILFYKDIKPFFLSRLIYYNRLYELELGRSAAGVQAIEAYFQKELLRLSTIYEQHAFIYRYLRSGATYLDDRLFFHPRPDSAVALYGSQAPPESGFPVCYDHAVAQLMAADLLQQYILEMLDEVHQQVTGPGGAVPRVTWTDSKTALIELAYALQSSGVLNNGKIDLKDVIEHLQASFHINLGNYPRTFQEILSRKTGYTNFIDRLRDKLLLRIQQIEEKYDR